MGAIVEPRSVDSSDRSNLMRAFIIGNGINCGRLSYDLMDALSPDQAYEPPTALKKTVFGPTMCWLEIQQKNIPFTRNLGKCEKINRRFENTCGVFYKNVRNVLPLTPCELQIAPWD
ncbi:hypothetical protein KGM_206659 [Danaus plexippus plexippus]|uniref:Uncharacterized protein n=1 Tax=Danaus plexippus plexippus TaxID=278856 RepID=A0A212FFM6_DANPL|nr:hypothetical protein KGM_206659 [Danaus plexippus plexippus]